MIPTYQSIYDMSRIRIVFRLSPLRSDEFHNLVLSFSRHSGVGYNDLHGLPGGVSVQLVRHPVSKTSSKDVHERCSWSDRIAVPCLLCDSLVRLVIAFVLLP